MTSRGKPSGDQQRADAPTWFAERFDRLVKNLELVVRGNREVIVQALTCFAAQGHLLLEGYPGVGKTSLAKAIAESVDLTWSRVQFTPDLLPSDVTGATMYNQRTGEFTFHKGPVFANIVVGDEINRASPKTQSALLEVMEERQVTVDGKAMSAEPLFMVIATQNPIELEGTYRLPEAQLDRFLMRVELGYPDEESERDVILSQRTTIHTPVRPVLTADELRSMIAMTARVALKAELATYIRQIAHATRDDAERSNKDRPLLLGVSPRGCLALARAARARALIAGRDFAVPEDVQMLAVPVLGHRVVLSPEAEFNGLRAADIIAAAVARTRVPVVAAA